MPREVSGTFGASARLVSLVVPTLREDEIGATLDRLAEELAGMGGYDFEMLLVDDSAEPYKRLMDEATAAFNARFGPKLQARRLDGPRKGKGAALRVGVLASRGDLVFWIDADLPIPLENIARFLRLLDDEGADIVIAERPMTRNVRQPVRLLASRALFAMQALVFQSWAFKDTQCGFKAFRGPLLRQIAERQIIDGGMVDIECLYAARRVGAKVLRIAVTPNAERRESRINVKRALIQDPIDLVRIRLRGLNDGYGAKGETEP
jgi:dolichyl-phosphate beta-glucosyltransferase